MPMQAGILEISPGAKRALVGKSNDPFEGIAQKTSH